MTKTCIIIDDEPLAIELIKDHLSKFSNFKVIGTCQNAIEGLEMLKSNPVDLMFLDIQMPTLTGIEFLKSLSNPPKVIFTTAYREYALESYELEVVDYLLKPISFDRFFKAINKFLKTDIAIQKPQLQPTKAEDSNTFIYVNANKKHHRINYDDILYAESLKDYIRIHTTATSITTKEKISDFEAKLPAYFLRTHRSYIINTHKISAYTMHDIEIGSIEIPIGISYKQQVLEQLKQG
jgi:DNA-binding LytR/AlgR family response regulator